LKLNVNENLNISETEIVINCSVMDIISRTSAISKGASLAPHEMSMLLAALLVTLCQGLFYLCNEMRIASLIAHHK
jgi:hypothetical protein